MSVHAGFNAGLEDIVSYPYAIVLEDDLGSVLCRSLLLPLRARIYTDKAEKPEGSNDNGFATDMHSLPLFVICHRSLATGKE